MIKKEQSLVKMLLPHIIAVVAFLFITMAYFSPMLQGKVLSQHDVTQYQGSAKEISDYYYNEGKTSAWTGSMFSGMPAYQIGVHGGSPNFLDYLEAPVKALGNTTAGPVFAGMLMAYILFCLMGFSPAVAILGAVAYSLSSYNIVILNAGHVTKAWALAYMPLIVAGFMSLFKNKILLGSVLVGLGLALQIKSNHLQVTYYTGLLSVILFITYAVEVLSKKNYKSFLMSCGAMIIAVALAVLANLGNIYGNMEMARESTRGKSELTSPKSESEKQSTGLDKDYAFGWSYGKAETFTFLVPNLYGGESKPYDKDAQSIKVLTQKVQSGEIPAEFANQVSRIPQYWGDQPFTQGTVYLGAIVCFLFLLGMIIIRSNVKWGLLVATIFFILLAWGKNLEWFNDWFFYHFPLYSKFRAVSTALVVPALTIVMVAVWGIKEFFSGEIDKKKLKKALYISLGVVGGLCLILWIAPGAFFNFTSGADAQWKAQVPEWYYNALLTDRQDLMSSDALRSLVFVLLGGAILYFSLRTKVDTKKMTIYGSLGLAVLVLIDLWGIDKRYLNENNFVAKSTYKTETFSPSVADQAILKDQHPSYRVLNLNNPFAETTTSYYHKSIGGYHAAKLKRYQELIDNRLDGEVNQIIGTFSSQNIDTIMASFNKTKALNMLNAKYVIYHPEQPPLVNPNAMGNAWFVNEYKLVNNADEEIAAINTLDPHTTAVVDKRFESELSGLKITPDSTATIELVSYKPDVLTYKTKAASEQLAVLSEIYFSNGWQAYVDGKEVPHFRADWTLRAMRVPAGEHEIVFKFEPQGYYNSRHVATASSAVLVLLLIGIIIRPFVLKRKEK
ncbi:MAG TPA: YfhO family protein [Dysgonomonas sp.]|uniref:YfhO family protein n=1 Tax=unclassified Dysgonomonas TaxID=2630389 RepID=UPI0025C3BF62|nr:MULTISPECIES: YfhO family protein [unclassified Dysgonomonas]HML64192.1 YfhO family protein [Dysgonomonas sp.]